MNEEYMPEYRPVDKRALAASLPNVKWGLVVMAVFCFAWSVYMYLTPPFGGCMFVATGLDRRIKLEDLYRGVLPFCLTGVLGILAVTYIQPLSMFLLNFMN